MLAHTYFKCHQKKARQKEERGGPIHPLKWAFSRERTASRERDTDDVSGPEMRNGFMTFLSHFHFHIPFPSFFPFFPFSNTAHKSFRATFQPRLRVSQGALRQREQPRDPGGPPRVALPRQQPGNPRRAGQQDHRCKRNVRRYSCGKFC